MPEVPTLEALAYELSLEDRKDLLEKLKSQSSISPEPLYEAREEGASAAGAAALPLTIEAQYAKLPWYSRLYYFILSFFKNTAPLKIFENTQAARLGREIDANFPGLYDYQQGNLQGDFYPLLSGLKEAARFFFEALDLSINRDRGAFYAFLGSLEMSQTHERLETETDPGNIAKKLPAAINSPGAAINSPGAASEAEIRQTALHVMEDAFAGIHEDQRDTMYRNARSLYCLKELSSFLFDRVLMAFSPAAGEARLATSPASSDAGTGPVCSIYVVREMLGSLNNILFSLREPPSLTLLESLFVFMLSGKAGSALMDREEPEFGAGGEIRNLLHQAEKAVATIRNFNKRIPLTLILRCGNRDMSLSPKIISGGEDWFAVYRDYWKRRVEDRLAEYQLSCRRQGILKSLQDFFKGAELKTLSGIASGPKGEGFPLKGAFALAFLRTFHAIVFMGGLNRVLKPIMDDEKRFRPEARARFTAGYFQLIKIEDEIRKLEAKIAPSGEYGKRYTLVRQDISALTVKRRKIQTVANEANAEAGKIIGSVRDAANIMISLLNGVLKNVTEEGSAPPEDITVALRQFERTLQLLDDIDAMESGSS